MATIELGAPGSPCRLDLSELIGTRLLVTGNSGAGKSRLLRRLIEQAAGKVQTIIIDPEGEYATLREKHDFMLAGSRGEVPASTRAAALLARRIMELRVSAVLDIYDLPWPERRIFVKLFLESLMHLEKKVYRPALVVIDEAHRFAPEGKSADDEAADSVIGLQSQGRKLGLCGLLASQRLSKIHKDAAAECNNVFTGRTWLDVDQKRAGDMLGYGAGDRGRLRDLPAGTFLAFGPSLDAAGHHGITEFRSGEVFTTHPRAGQAYKIEPPAPSDAIQAVAAQLKDLPAEAEEAIKTFEAAKAKIRDLELEVRRARAAQPAPPPLPAAPKPIEVPVLRAGELKDLDATARWGVRTSESLAKLGAEFVEAAAEYGTAGKAILESLKALSAPRPVAPAPPPRPAVPQVPRAEGTTLDRGDNGGPPTGGLRSVMIALAQRPGGLSKRRLGIVAGVVPRGGSFDGYMARSRRNGWLVIEDGVYKITDAGVAALGSYDPLPTGKALLEHWQKHLPSGAADILQAHVDAYPSGLTREHIGEATGKAARGGAFDSHMARLAALELITRRERRTFASPDLFRLT